MSKDNIVPQVPYSDETVRESVHKGAMLGRAMDEDIRVAYDEAMTEQHNADDRVIFPGDIKATYGYRVLTTTQLRNLAQEAARLGYNRQVDPDTLRMLAPDARHLLAPLLEHHHIAGEPAPMHLRVSAYIQLIGRSKTSSPTAPVTSARASAVEGSPRSR